MNKNNSVTIYKTANDTEGADQSRRQDQDKHSSKTRNSTYSSTNTTQLAEHRQVDDDGTDF